jgi:hypothetical protein
MTSLATVTKSPTLELSTEQRDRLVDLIADRYLDNMDVDDLARFFRDVQREYLGEYDDEELVGALEDVTHEDEYEEIMEDLAK